jgi:hypothetical protein
MTYVKMMFKLPHALSADACAEEAAVDTTSSAQIVIIVLSECIIVHVEDVEYSAITLVSFL